MEPVFAEIIGWEFLLVLAVIALLFGSSQLPKLARSIGQASSELRKGMSEGAAEGATPGPDEPSAPPTSAPPTSAPPPVTQPPAPDTESREQPM